ILWALPGQEAAFLAPLEVRKIPGVGKVTEKRLLAWGVRRVGDLNGLGERFLETNLGKWGLALAGKAQGLDAGGYFDSDVGEEQDPKSISHEHTFNEDTADTDVLESTLAKLSQMVARRLREHHLHSRTIQVKYRYSDFSTFTRAATLDHGTQLDIDLVEYSRALFRANWTGAAIRLLGVQASSLGVEEGQMNLLEEERTSRWRSALDAVDRIYTRFGDNSISLAAGMKGVYREKVHENPENLPGKAPSDRSQRGQHAERGNEAQRDKDAPDGKEKKNQ
ncbi:MAG: DNA polymerase Y family protein, partial [Bryobacteraceae bacterium]